MNVIEGTKHFNLKPIILTLQTEKKNYISCDYLKQKCLDNSFRDTQGKSTRSSTTNCSSARAE